MEIGEAMRVNKERVKRVEEEKERIRASKDYRSMYRRASGGIFEGRLRRHAGKSPVVRFRLPADEYERLMRRAEVLGMTRSQLCRWELRRVCQEPLPDEWGEREKAERKGTKNLAAYLPTSMDPDWNPEEWERQKALLRAGRMEELERARLEVERSRRRRAEIVEKRLGKVKEKQKEVEDGEKVGEGASDIPESD